MANIPTNISENMPLASLMYALIAHGQEKLIELRNGNAGTMAETILKKLNKKSEKSENTQAQQHGTGNKIATEAAATLVYQQFVWHYQRRTDDDVIVLLMTNKRFPRKAAFSCIEEIIQQFNEQFPLITNEADGKDGRKRHEKWDFLSFMPKLRTSIEKWNAKVAEQPPSQDYTKLYDIKGELDSANDSLISNLENVLERGEKIELLIDKSEAMNDSAVRFRRDTRNLRRTLWWRNIKSNAIGIGVCIAVVYILYLMLR